MGHADSKVDVSGRRMLPPVRSHGGPVSMVVPAGTAKRSPLPPPPPLAALRSRTAPAQAGTEEPLALVPQWEDYAAPMRPAPKRALGAAFWLKFGGASLAAGALVAAGYFGALTQSSKQASGVAQPSALESVRTLATKSDSPMLTSTAPAAPRGTQLDTPIASQAPSFAPQSDTVAVNAQPKAKRAVSAKPSRSAAIKAARAKRSKAAAAIALELPAPAQAVDAAESRAPNAGLAGTTKKAPVPAPALPAQPSRSDVQAGIESVRPALDNCAAGAHGTVFANLTIQGTGHVSYSVVEGEFTSGSVGTCMARVLRAANFPQFSGPSLKVRYPFVF